eukprot:CAMPEP_0113627494 /NCGR_PEP_ID=MMETSP0017_2-20120614/14240_1 /TAXON_ID=2856 /ORGANISM="Cylindrotheca closterium" /LENGTH=216 /DNA_ID=CAMNT_0000537753 /DNA_START=34 /DNA_END=685 /DNA_ORIENTATION=+ /assembly_acc=CAM_ASM_000147
MTTFQRRRSDTSSVISGDSSVISAITMDDDFDSSRRSRNPYRFDPKLGPLSEQKRASDWNEEQVKLCIDELRVPGRNDNRFSSCSEGDKQLCAIPQRRLSVEMELFFWEDDGETKEAEADDDDEDDASQASMETSEGSYYAYDSIEMGFDEEEHEYEIPTKSGEDVLTMKVEHAATIGEDAGARLLFVLHFLLVRSPAMREGLAFTESHIHSQLDR